MAYITKSEYDAYLGEAIPADDFPRYAARASEAVDAACGWKIALAGLESFDSFDQTQIKLAVCAQCEALYLGGIENALGDSAGTGGYYSIGKTSVMSYGGKQGSTGSGSAATQLCAKASGALFPTGLLYTGVAVR